MPRYPPYHLASKTLERLFGAAFMRHPEYTLNPVVRVTDYRYLRWLCLTFGHCESVAAAKEAMDKIMSSG